MCGRYALKIAVPDLARRLGVEPSITSGPRFNIAPTQPVPVVRTLEGTRRLELMRWGLVPSWSKGPDGRYAMHNARIEGITTKPAYRGPVRRQRCLVPADGWYEWQKVGARKQPWFIGSDDGEPVCFAGVWEQWHGAEAPLLSCSIITGPAQPDLAAIHHRMPLVVSSAHWEAWLDGSSGDPGAALELIAGESPVPLVAWAVSSHVNNARNDDPRCLESIPGG